ncbi:NADPH-dependent FMN reductase [Flavobacterium antarcticum]|uniref:NADPH-dependent FMN reductase n=1 Tax=Flavobacterium antarcticum TaxID=271155 RepID=UPI0003B5C84C|nr:NAD(P)H-dependent oxidoreductase [Flavobacterium antarcticum]
MKIIAFAGSNHSNSINKKLATYASSLFKNCEVEVLDLNHYEAPLFSIDTEKVIGQAEEAKSFLEKINSADILVVSLAEHNGNYAAAFKNLIDWCSRIEKGFFQNKPMLLMATSPGARGGKSVLEIAQNNLTRFDANIQAVFSLPSFNENFDLETNRITNADLDSELKQNVQKLQILIDEESAYNFS